MLVNYRWTRLLRPATDHVCLDATFRHVCCNVAPSGANSQSIANRTVRGKTWQLGGKMHEQTRHEQVFRYAFEAQLDNFVPLIERRQRRPLWTSLDNYCHVSRADPSRYADRAGLDERDQAISKYAQAFRDWRPSLPKPERVIVRMHFPDCD